jgi:hypothetical protein
MFRLYASDLSEAIYKLSREMLFDTRKMSRNDLTKALDRGNVEAGTTERETKWHDQVLEVNWMPRPQETKPEAISMSITGITQGTIAAKLARIKEKAQDRLNAKLAEVDTAHDAGLARVDAALDDVVEKINREIDDQIQEFAATTNGGPA